MVPIIAKDYSGNIGANSYQTTVGADRVLTYDADGNLTAINNQISALSTNCQ